MERLNTQESGIGGHVNLVVKIRSIFYGIFIVSRVLWQSVGWICILFMICTADIKLIPPVSRICCGLVVLC